MDGPAGNVTLQALRVADADVIARWASDPRFCRAAGWSIGQPFVEVRRFHRTLIESAPSGLIRMGAIYDGALVGYVDLHGREPHRRELGFVIGERRRWSRGLGRLAAEEGLRLGFDQLGLHEVWAEALDANQGSIRILQRLGLTETSEATTARFSISPLTIAGSPSQQTCRLAAIPQHPSMS